MNEIKLLLENMGDKKEHMNCDKKINLYKYLDLIIFALFMVIYVAITLLLFYRQTMEYNGQYPSDMYEYIRIIQNVDELKRAPYPVLFRLGYVFEFFFHSPQLCMALAVTILNAMTPIVLKYYFEKQLIKKMLYEVNDECRKFCLKQLITVLVFLLLIVSMLYPLRGRHLFGIGYDYLGVFSPNPFHNATYKATRPFAIIVFFLFVDILEKYEKKISIKDFTLFAFFLFVTTITKPTFTFVLVPTAGIIMMCRLLQSRFVNLLQSVKLGVCFIPTFIILLVQYLGLFTPHSEGDIYSGVNNSIRVGLFVAWKQYCDNIPLAICLALAFPLIVLFIHLKALRKNTMYRFSWQILLMSFLEAILFYESGSRMKDMNFFWGYMHGMSFVFWTSTIILVEDTLNHIRTNHSPMSKFSLIVFQWFVFGVHVLCGINYFIRIFLGGSYY